MFPTFNLHKYMSWNEDYQDNYSPVSQNRILMQYTGLKDKNGVEIYEGDYVSDGEDIIVVRPPEWIDIDAFRVYGYKNLHSFLNVDQYSSKEISPSDFIKNCEVIGNMYQNKELEENV